MPWFPVCSAFIAPPSPELVIIRVEKTKLEKYSEEIRSRPDIRFIPFRGITEFGALSGHATVFLIDMVRHKAAFKGMHVGKLLNSWRRRVSLAVYVAHADNVVRGLSAVADGVEAASSSAGMPSLTTVLLTHAMARKRPRAS
jgi:hypothetical protein